MKSSVSTRPSRVRVVRFSKTGTSTRVTPPGSCPPMPTIAVAAAAGERQRRRERAEQRRAGAARAAHPRPSPATTMLSSRPGM